MSGHTGITKTYEKVKESFIWDGLWRDVVKFASECLPCQQNKVDSWLPTGLLQPLPIPEGKWTHIAMDFITGLPSTDKGWDIFVVVDRMTKQAHFIPTRTRYSASQVAWQFIEYVFKHHGFPQEIVSDRDAKFMGHFWQELFIAVGTSLAPSTAYHP